MAINVTAKPGERSAAVKELQSALAFLGLYKFAIDGWYGPKTVEAVKALQRMTRSAGYDPGPIDGWFGPQSQQAFNAWDRAVNPQNYPTAAPPAAPPPASSGAGGVGATPPPPAPPAPVVPPSPPAVPPPATIPTDSGESARTIVTGYLSSIGLEGLTDWAYQQITTDAAFDLNRFLIEMREQPVYKARFAGNEQRKRNGLAPLDEGVYLQLEEAYATNYRELGLPKGFYDSPDDFANLIGNSVSAAEHAKRLDIMEQYVMSSPNVAEVRTALAQEWGIAATDGDLAAYLIDPDRALPLLMRQFRGAAAMVAAQRAGVNIGGAEVAEWAGGFSEAAQQAAYGQVAAQTPLLERLYATEEAIDTQEALSASLEGNAAAAARIETRRRQRIARSINQQAGFTTDAEGRTSLGSTQ